MSVLTMIDANKIEPFPELVREVYPKKKWLKESIRKNGVLEPVHVVKKTGTKDRYWCYIGNHRVEYAREISEEDNDSEKRFVPAFIDDISREEALHRGWISDDLRAPRNAMDKSTTINMMLKSGKSYSEIAEILFEGKEHKQLVWNYAKLVNLPISVQNRIKEGKLEWSKAIPLLKLENKKKIEDACEEILLEGYKREQIEEMVDEHSFGSYNRLYDKKSRPKGAKTVCFLCGERHPFETSHQEQICYPCRKDPERAFRKSQKSLKSLKIKLRYVNLMLNDIDQEIDKLKAELGITSANRLTEVSSSYNRLYEAEPRPKARPDLTWARGLDWGQKRLCILKAIEQGTSCREAKDSLLADGD
jgi:ParB/RepB/Spo0J family partition protein